MIARPPGRRVLRSGAARGLGGVLAAMMLGCTVPATSRTEIVIEDPSAFPENITATRDGTLITGSVGSGGIFRAAPGAAKATRWIKAGDNGLLDTFGVLADERSNTLWVCSARMDPPIGEAPAVPALFNYDLATGRFRSKHPFPGGTGLCNDIAIGPDKSPYVTDTIGSRVLRLPGGTGDLEEWAKSADLEGADGLDFDGRHLFVNGFTTGKLLRIELKVDGSAGTPVTLKTSRPLTRPDGMRRLRADRFILAEGAGEIVLLTVKGDMAEVEALRSGLNGPAGVAIVGETLWALESKLAMRGDARAQAAPFKAYASRLPPL